MTIQKTFKRRVRARMAKTGESYTAARRVLIAHGDRPEPAAVAFEPPLSVEKVTEATGRSWDAWFAALDAWGAAGRTHTEMARWLREEQGVASWWSQSITVAYEQARGLRAPGQNADGFALSASKTIGVPVERLFEAWSDESLRERWLPGADLRLRTATSPKSARYDWEDGTTRVNVGFEAVGEGRSRVALAHERLPDAETREEMKRWWGERLATLKPLLEQEEAA
jgi:hypothetical protein